MRRHTVTDQELDEWLRQPQWKMFASSGSETSNKRLLVDGGATTVFRVIDHGETVFLGADRAAAIAAYNNAP